MVAKNNPQLTNIAVEICKKEGFVNLGFKGEGSFKETYQIRDKHGNSIALKILIPNISDIMRTKREIEAMKKCNSPCIGKLYDTGKYINSKGEEFLYLLEEYFDDGTLKNKLSNTTFSVKTLKPIAIALLTALEYLKDIKLVHRDIKPDNIMFKNLNVSPSLIDFGLVRDLSQSSITKSYLSQGPGTPYFSAPEQLNNEKRLISWRTDQFALGLVLGICLNNLHPFNENNDSPIVVIDRMASKKKCTKRFADHMKSLNLESITKMIEPWPIQRFSNIDEIKKLFS